MNPTPSRSRTLALADSAGALWTNVKGLQPRVWVPIGIGILVGVLLFGSLSTNLGVMNTLAVVFMYGALAQAWNILGGYGGYINFGMAALFGVGAYTTAILSHYSSLSPLVTVPIAGLVTLAFGLAIGVPTLRLRGAYFVIVTLIITFAVQLVALNVPFTRQALGIYLPILPFTPRETLQVFYGVFFLLMLATTALVYKIERSNFGWALVAIREDEDAAEVLGVWTTGVKNGAFLIGAFIAGIVGGVYSYQILYIEPTGTFSLDISLTVVLIAVIGGAGYWQGPLLGAPIIILLADILRVWIPSEANRIIFGVLLMAVALFFPDGITGLLRGRPGRRFLV